MKKKYKLLSILKKIKKNNLFNSLGTLNNEKNKLESINLELQKLLEKSNFKEGSIISASQLKNNSFFRRDINEKIEISKNRKLHIEKEITGYVSQISKVNKQQEIIQKRIYEDFTILQNKKDLKNQQNFKAKNVL
ncbi:MAG: hypothetical protein CMP38_02205 [Rickettsiales bacterium]|nr:hypothetical protein [Rickettsiales bacterium]|tara:strand:+ start:2525 stop:2929 length:405 start_codon:yes stop_codon:yes gene_type:complete